MSKTIYIVNNYNTDKFKDFQVPAFNTGDTQSIAAPVSNANEETQSPFHMPIIITIIILVIIVAILIIKKIKENIIKQIQIAVCETTKTNEENNEENQTTNVLISKADKKSKKNKSYATPKNLQQCIMLFLENTKNKK